MLEQADINREERAAEDIGTPPSSKIGRPAKKSEDLSSFCRRRLSASLTGYAGLGQLVEAGRQSARKLGQKDTAFVLKQVQASPGRPRKIRMALRRAVAKPRCLTGQEALAVCVMADLSVRGCKLVRRVIRSAAKTHILTMR